MSAIANLADLSLSAVTASNKNSVSLASFSGDFTLIKFQPPAEFSALGKALSPARRQNAEDGPAHKTARRLGALFQQIIPSTPKLVEAYGRRATEIVETPGLNPRGSKHDGAFEKYVGMDYTTIWAAVTSGTASLGVHLLSCMLARAWEPKEAVAIWVELVNFRQKEIMTGLDQQYHIIGNETAIAAHQEITREELALWDNGARSWLRQADRAKPRDFDRFRLIAANAGVAYPAGGAGKSLYKSVIETWTQSMVCAENLFKELPQQVSDRGILLAISAWHLYPDLAVFGGSTSAPPKVAFNDPLVPSRAVLTVGLERQCLPEAENTDRIKWSLALSHLHYYGDPVKVLSTEDTTRVSMVELQIIALGYLLDQWSFTEGDWQVLDTLAWLKGLWDFLKQHTETNSANQSLKLELAELRWLSVLAEASSYVLETATPMLNTSGTDSNSGPIPTARISGLSHMPQEENWSHFEMNSKCKQLLNFGKRRCAKMLGGTPYPPGSYGLFFGLCNPLAYTAFEQNVDCDVGIRYLREIASVMGLACDEAVISFSVVEGGICYYEYATVGQPSLKHPHGRWIQVANCRNAKTFLFSDETIPPRFFTKILESESPCECLGYCLEACPCKSAMKQCRSDCHPPGNPHSCSNSIMEVQSRVQTLQEQGEDARLSRDLLDLNGHYPHGRLVSQNLDLPIPQVLLPQQGNLIPQLTWNDPPEIFTRRIVSNAPVHTCSRTSPKSPCDCFSWKSTGTQNSQRSVSFARCFSFLGSNSSGGGFELWVRDWPDFESAEEWIPRYSQKILYAQGRLTSPKLGLQWLKSGAVRSHWIWEYIRKISGIDQAYLTRRDPQQAGYGYEHEWAPWKSNTFWATRMISDWSHTTQTYIDSMNVLGLAAEVYHGLPHATIPTKILGFPLLHAKWAKPFVQGFSGDLNKLSNSRNLKRPAVFACIAMFETGRINLGPEELTSVLAICVENSIFAAGILFSDPVEWPSGKNIRHIIGNTGHSGLVMLVAPNNPRIRPLSDDYTVTQYDQYDLKQEDNFQKSSLHLSFTKWKFPISVGDVVGTSSIDHEVQFVESVIELWDGKDWVADLDILGLERFGNYHLISRVNENCTHDNPSREWQRSFTSLDVWDELLEPPKEIGVFRAHGNWVARLAATSILIQKNWGENILVLGDSTQKYCWECIRKEIENGRPVRFIVD
jgi:hypothetical protein